MNVVTHKIGLNPELDQIDYSSLESWEVARDGDDSFAIGVVYVDSDSEYKLLFSQINLEDISFNYLLIHTDGKIIAYKYKNEFMQYSYGNKFFKIASLEKVGYQKSITNFLAEKFSIYQFRVFLCHASEDKNDVILPLTRALKSADIDYWVDSAAIKLGDSITEKVNEGLRTSNYCILVLSKSFVGKPWPERELNSILNMRIAAEKEIIPVLVGTAEEQIKIRNNYPLLNDLYHRKELTEI